MLSHTHSHEIWRTEDFCSQPLPTTNSEVALLSGGLRTNALQSTCCQSMTSLRCPHSQYVCLRACKYICIDQSCQMLSHGFSHYCSDYIEFYGSVWFWISFKFYWILPLHMRWQFTWLVDRCGDTASVFPYWWKAKRCRVYSPLMGIPAW